MRAEVLRRAALGREPHPEGVRKPRLGLFARELASLWGMGTPRRGAVLAARSPQPVMLLPGFGAHPKRMRAMAEALAEAGHAVHEWGLGFNLGPTPENFAFLMRRVARLARDHRQPVVLVGWSLGGLFAREIARREPALVAKVITMGTPFSGDPRANNAWRAYQVITGHSVDAPPVECALGVKPPVPTIALWSPRDGVIHPRSAKGWPSERDRAVAIRCSHLGFASDARVIGEVLRQIDVEEPRAALPVG
ncbi:alpha/beta hydrolase [Novosphingobium sp. 1949]|uniref:Alpha/beta hydrolase n=1 Tax=Novosphingobium organovorum TaxID=2930092 RepID=A0ABT0BDE4_9SPHN|nr:alpha/beta fold hydrolase [Novosphingobium organovorum]MCJ2183096.1 alpha/beta hydrolase [Novosphingobium organovorum]